MKTPTLKAWMAAALLAGLLANSTALAEVKVLAVKGNVYAVNEMTGEKILLKKGMVVPDGATIKTGVTASLVLEMHKPRHYYEIGAQETVTLPSSTLASR